MRDDDAAAINASRRALGAAEAGAGDALLVALTSRPFRAVNVTLSARAACRRRRPRGSRSTAARGRRRGASRSPPSTTRATAATRYADVLRMRARARSADALYDGRGANASVAVVEDDRAGIVLANLPGDVDAAPPAARARSSRRPATARAARSRSRSPRPTSGSRTTCGSARSPSAT